jgi:hypothetical protein
MSPLRRFVAASLRRFLLPLALLALPCSPARTAPAAGPADKAEAQVSLPLVLPDDSGVSWDVQNDGSIGDGGNDEYDGGGHLFSQSNAQFYAQNVASFNRQRNEVTLGPMQMDNLIVSRRIAVNQKLSFCRFTEIFENPGPAPVKTQFHVYFNLGGAVGRTQPLVDERHGKRIIGMAVDDQRNVLAMVGGGRGAKVTPRMDIQQNTDNVNIWYDVEVPAHSTIAIVHIQARRGNLQDAARWMEQMKDRQYLQGMDPKIARLVVNFLRDNQFIGDEPILRGEMFDVLELKGGDRCCGTVKQSSFAMQSACGRVSVPAEQVISIINAGEFRPRQLLVTRDGEIIGGCLENQRLDFELTTGQMLHVPWNQIARVGYRKSDDEAEEWNLDHALVELSGGDRLSIGIPQSPVEVATQFGLLSIPAAAIHSIAFADGDHETHVIELTDGSRISGLVTAREFELFVGPGRADGAGAGGGGEGGVGRIPASAIHRLQFNGLPPEVEEDAPTLALAGGDLLFGTLRGALQLDTGFARIDVEAAQIRGLEHIEGRELEVRLEMWDGSTMSGQVQQPAIDAVLTCGVPLRLPLALIGRYKQPYPHPSKALCRKFEQVLPKLASVDWRERDRAEAELIAMGPDAVGLLRELRASQPRETQTRLASLIEELKEIGNTPAAPAAPPADGSQSQDGDGDGIIDAVNINFNP